MSSLLHPHTHLPHRSRARRRYSRSRRPEWLQLLAFTCFALVVTAFTLAVAVPLLR